MAARWLGLTIDCADPQRLARFWSGVLGRPISAEHGADADWASVGARGDAHPRLTFQRVPEPNATKVRLHLDVEVDEIEAGRARVEALGGRWSGQRRDYDEGVVLLMHDPEGHEFCLVQFL